MRQELIYRRRSDGATFVELAGELGITSVRVSQIYRAAARELRGEHSWWHGLSTRTRNILEYAGCSSAEDARRLYVSGKLIPAGRKGSTRNYGWKSHRELAAWLKLPVPTPYHPSALPNTRHADQRKNIPRFIAVVHVPHSSAIGSEAHTLGQVGLALEYGAGGVFLIDHYGNHAELRTLCDKVRAGFEDAWIGVNFLDLKARDALCNVPDSMDALWLDSGMGILAADLRRSRNFHVFAGAGFKYQNTALDHEMEAALVAAAFDVVTTSGPGTGKAIDMPKLRMICKGAGNAPVALASGVTLENIEPTLPFVSHYLVASGISIDVHNLDSGKVRDLAERIKKDLPPPGPKDNLAA